MAGRVSQLEGRTPDGLSGRESTRSIGDLRPLIRLSVSALLSRDDRFIAYDSKDRGGKPSVWVRSLEELFPE